MPGDLGGPAVLIPPDPATPPVEGVRRYITSVIVDNWICAPNMCSRDDRKRAPGMMEDEPGMIENEAHGMNTGPPG